MRFDPDYAVIPLYQPPPLPPEPAPLPFPLSVADREAVEGLGGEDLQALFGALLLEAYRQRRLPRPSLVSTASIIRLNGMLARVRLWAGRLRRSEPIPSVPEHVLLSPVEMIGPLEAAQRVLHEVAKHHRWIAPMSGWDGGPTHG